jgi:hypothetical protein
MYLRPILDLRSCSWATANGLKTLSVQHAHTARTFPFALLPRQDIRQLLSALSRPHAGEDYCEYNENDDDCAARYGNDQDELMCGGGPGRIG